MIWHKKINFLLKIVLLLGRVGRNIVLLDSSSEPGARIKMSRNAKDAKFLSSVARNVGKKVVLS